MVSNSESLVHGLELKATVEFFFCILKCCECLAVAAAEWLVASCVAFGGAQMREDDVDIEIRITVQSFVWRRSTGFVELGDYGTAE